MDNKIKNALISTLHIELDETQWSQASLPVPFGGLGIRKISDISLPFFLSSSYSVKELLSTITHIQDYDSELPYLEEAMQVWNEPKNDFPKVPVFQSTWDHVNIKRLSGDLSLNSRIQKFHFESLQNQFSGAWLSAIPNQT